MLSCALLFCWIVLFYAFCWLLFMGRFIYFYTVLFGLHVVVVHLNVLGDCMKLSDIVIRCKFFEWWIVAAGRHFMVFLIFAPFLWLGSWSLYAYCLWSEWTARLGFCLWKFLLGRFFMRALLICGYFGLIFFILIFWFLELVHNLLDGFLALLYLFESGCFFLLDGSSKSYISVQFALMVL